MITLPQPLGDIKISGPWGMWQFFQIILCHPNIEYCHLKFLSSQKNLKFFMQLYFTYVKWISERGQSLVGFL